MDIFNVQQAFRKQQGRGRTWPCALLPADLLAVQGEAG